MTKQPDYKDWTAQELKTKKALIQKHHDKLLLATVSMAIAGAGGLFGTGIGVIGEAGGVAGLLAWGVAVGTGVFASRATHKIHDIEEVQHKLPKEEKPWQPTAELEQASAQEPTKGPGADVGGQVVDISAGDSPDDKKREIS